MTPMVLRSLTVNKEQAAILRVALAALLERRDTLSDEGRAIARDLATRTSDILADIEQNEARRR